jgi:GxxExxY protein
LLVFFRVFRVFRGLTSVGFIMHAADNELIFREETYQILGACFEVYKEMGCGFLEAVYQECLAIEFALRNIPHAAKPTVALAYKGRTLEHGYQPDFICFEKVVVELKAVSVLADEHRAQLLNYLNAAKLPVGLLINFGHYPKLEYERMIYTINPTEHTE